MKSFGRSAKMRIVGFHPNRITTNMEIIELKFVTGKDPLKLAWKNMKVADEKFHLEFFMASAIAWFKLNPSSTPQDLEKELRDRKFETHLIARNSVLGKEFKRFNIHTDPNSTALFDCMYSCRPKKYALEELLEHSKSYEENFVKLKDTGIIGVSDISVVNANKNIKKFSKKEKTVGEKISNGEAQLVCSRLNFDDSVNYIVRTIHEKYKQTPKILMIGMTNNGDPIMGFTIENKIVSETGFIMGHNPKFVKLV